MSPVFDCTTEQGRSDGIPKAARGVREGQIVVLPTDTVYGIGADAFTPSAVRALLAAKGRGPEMPPPVLVGSIAALDGLAIDVPDYARALIERYWPGALTLVLMAQPSLRWDLGETHGTVAVRMPDDEVALALLHEVGPMAVSSANRTGHPSSRTVLDAASQLGASVEFYLDGGPSPGGLASTIVDCTGPTPTILRTGAIAAEDILAVVAEHESAEHKSAEHASAEHESAERASAGPSQPLTDTPDPAPESSENHE